MIKVNVLYPYRENGRFDVDYYCGTHMPLAEKLFGPLLESWSVEVGVNGGAPGSTPPYFAIGHFMFAKVEDFYQVFNPVADQLLGDVPNYYDGQPQIMISEIKIPA